MLHTCAPVPWYVKGQLWREAALSFRSLRNRIGQPNAFTHLADFAAPNYNPCENLCWFLPPFIFYLYYNPLVMEESMVLTERIFSHLPTILNAINNLLAFVIGTFI